jgi:protein-S-isoprenylcysteine O-methyltransferase Ste14
MTAASFCSAVLLIRLAIATAARICSGVAPLSRAAFTWYAVQGWHPAATDAPIAMSALSFSVNTFWFGMQRPYVYPPDEIRRSRDTPGLYPFWQGRRLRRRMTTTKRLLANSIMALAVVCGVGSLALFVAVPAGSLHLVRMQWPEAGVLWWDGFLSLAFFLQHSGMVRRRFRARIAGLIPPRYYRAVYAIASGVVLSMVVLLWQPSGNRLLVLGGVSRWVAQGGAVLAIAVFIWSGFALQGFDPFGLGAIKAYLRGSAEQAPVFVVRGPYRWVRHPWYLCALMLIWSCPDLTADRLLFNILWTVWICVGARLEEADLASDFGQAYDGYRRKVPMLIPWRGPATL